jgi:hypothetical protein
VKVREAVLAYRRLIPFWLTPISVPNPFFKESSLSGFADREHRGENQLEEPQDRLAALDPSNPNQRWLRAGATTRQRDHGSAMAFGRAEQDRDRDSVVGVGVVLMAALF